MWSVVIIEVLEAVDHGVERLDGLGRVVDAVELVSPRTIAAFDGPVELGPLGREFVEFDALVLAGLFELGLELASAVDPGLRRGRLWIALTGKGMSAIARQMIPRTICCVAVKEARGGVGCGAAGGLSDGPFGDGIISGEVLDMVLWADLHEDVIDLDVLAGMGGLEMLWQVHGVMASGGPSAGFHRFAGSAHGLYHAAFDKCCDDPPYGHVTDGKALIAQQRTQLGPAPEREVKRNVRWAAEPVDAALVAEVQAILAPLIDRDWY